MLADEERVAHDRNHIIAAVIAGTPFLTRGRAMSLTGIFATGWDSFRARTPSKNWVHRFWKMPPNKIMLGFFLENLYGRITFIKSLSSYPSIADRHISALEEQYKEIQNKILNKIDADTTGRLFSHADDGWDELWNHAYRLQSHTATAEPPDTLILELERITQKSVSEHIEGADRLEKNLREAKTKYLTDSTENSAPKIKTGYENSVRKLLFDALDQYNCSLQTKFICRSFQKEASNRTMSIGVLALVLFIMQYVFLYCCTNLNPGHLDLAWIPIYSVTASGLFGAFFSRLIFLQGTLARSSSLGKLSDARRWISIFLRGLTGICGAIIVYFFLQSGLITGDLIPDINSLGIKEVSLKGISGSIVVPNKAWALLVVWCFLAGFSERLVPNILTSTEKRLAAATKQ